MSVQFNSRLAAVSSCLALVVTWAVIPMVWAGDSPTGFELLGRGINFGNMLEAPNEGDWGSSFEDDFPKLIKQAGFDSVRLPVRWSAHTNGKPDYLIERAIMDRVKHIVKLCLDNDLKVVLNAHHFEEIYEDPAGHTEHLLAIWRQISEVFQGADSRIVFEILNEPHGNLISDPWNSILAKAIAEIRKLHPDRWIVVGPDQWNNAGRLPALVLPEADQRLIVTVHYYLPFEFTHQGAPWVEPKLPKDIQWAGAAKEVEEVERHFAEVAKWANAHGRPVYVGEFGAYNEADIKSRARWTRQVVLSCERNGFGWAYWELCSGFGVLNAPSRKWNPELLDSLIQVK